MSQFLFQCCLHFEVLPVFPQLVSLPLEKFQTALARLLQGSAHTGPALTPAEVLVSIHGIVPEKDGLALKKVHPLVGLDIWPCQGASLPVSVINGGYPLFLDALYMITDACSACFEQGTVFTQQVLAKALNQMVDQTHLPLLFMRTVIKAIDGLPSLVEFVMEILSKLQVWRMPNLWYGFLKCASQTQPHFFHVLLQLPPPQLESTLYKYANLRGPLAAYASQPSVNASLHRTLAATACATIVLPYRHKLISSWGGLQHDNYKATQAHQFIEQLPRDN